MGHPLLCWDICVEGEARRIKLAEDLKVLKEISRKRQWSELFDSLSNTLVWENKVIIVTDPGLNIMHVTENMFNMNGYTQADVIGNSPRMFQGERTEMSDRELIRHAVQNQRAFETTITNYRKDGSIYRCHIEGIPIFNSKNNLVNFIALENAA